MIKMIKMIKLLIFCNNNKGKIPFCKTPSLLKPKNHFQKENTTYY